MLVGSFFCSTWSWPHGHRAGRGARRHGGVLLSGVITLVCAASVLIVPGRADAAGSAAVLGPGHFLRSGQVMPTGNGWLLSMQTDGNLVVYAPGKVARWASGTGGHPGAYLTMQRDGNAVVYPLRRRSGRLWASNTNDHPGASLRMQADGNLVVSSREGDPLWATNTKDLTPPVVIRLAPVVWLNRFERSQPVDADTYVGASALYWSGASRCRTVRIAGWGGIDQARLGSGGYLYRPYRGRCLHDPRYLSSKDDTRPSGADRQGFFMSPRNKVEAAGTQAPVYYEYKPGQYVTYWFFYGFNDALGVRWDHEGDWERISIRLDGDERPKAVAFYQHDGYCTQEWSGVSRTSTGHPHVFSALGTHATYESAGYFLQRLRLPDKKTIGTLTDVTGAGRRWNSYDHLTNVNDHPWYGFGGGWGQISPNTPGPLGPGPHKGAAPVPGEASRSC